MIDEKKIEEAADAYLLEKLKDNVIGDSDFKDIPNAFKAGINWFLDDLWHDASEEPKKDKLMLVQRTSLSSISMEFIILWCSKNGTSWYEVASGIKITRWLYIEDLTKGKSNG